MQLPALDKIREARAMLHHSRFLREQTTWTPGAVSQKHARDKSASHHPPLSSLTHNKRLIGAPVDILPFFNPPSTSSQRDIFKNNSAYHSSA